MEEQKIHNNISVDCVIFGFDSERLKVLLVERTLFEPGTTTVVFSDLTLTGNHIFEHEDLDAAATRILNDLTGLQNIFLEQFQAFGHPDRLKNPNDIQWAVANGRDPNSHIITIGYFSLLNIKDIELQYKGRNVAWYPVEEVKELGFDHKQILDQALVALRNKLQREPIGFELLPDKFTLTQMQKLYEAIMGSLLDKRNFRKKVARMKYLIPLDEKQTGQAHRPPRLFFFSREVYEFTKKEMLWFAV
jgi:8-oxo-dGTP diphosphatase